MNDAPQVIPPLVVGSDPVRTERAMRPAFLFTMFGAALIPLVAVFLSALTASSSGLGLGLVSGLSFTVVSWLMLFAVVQLATARGAQSIARPVLTLDANGLTGSIPQGDVFLPWAAIDRISTRKRGGSRIATFHLAPGLTEQSAGVASTLPPASFRTLVKRGFQVGEVAIDTPLDALTAAASAFTAGRLR
ncbi:hypothetical protein [Microbacterium sp. cf332]|uniref:hypothetical protein n=1 Tax=Microbacterium sp. cf332 TaxID=1761804 RepID=UPI0008850D40|nr:hypothetical protein [Microbacterium sp. cf332]SDQ54768.1 hypothetical protein SAMN04487847_1802 [Microbacterium sp. cf332]